MMPTDKKSQNKKVLKKIDEKDQKKSKKNEYVKPIDDKTEAKHKIEPSKYLTQETDPDPFKHLKRETDDILKISEEANLKYKKKEIQSNWSKYEMPIDSYEDIEEQNIGADYEKLIQAPSSIGGHFQFKHEKTWDTHTAPSLYDKYFDVNMENLALSLNSIPFYERNSIDKSTFRESDVLSMDNRSINYKQRYFKDKSFTTEHIEAQQNILKRLKQDTCDGLSSNSGNKLNNEDETLSLKLNPNKTTQNIAITNDFKSNSRNMESEINDLFSSVDLKHKEAADSPNFVKKELLHSKDDSEQRILNQSECPEELEKWLDDFLEEK